MVSLNPQYYFKKIQRKISIKFFINEEKINKEENQKLASLGDIEVALDKLNKILISKYERPFDLKRDSIHWLLWSILSLNVPVKRILEIGTYKGEGTYLLAKLFPEAEVVTVDLPEDDPILRSTYKRQLDEEYKKYAEEQKTNLSLSNITFIKSNSFFIPENIEGRFGLLWVDGGHLLPEIAWDLCNAWNMCESGGVIMCDDVLISEKNISNQYASSDSYKIMNYIQARKSFVSALFLKRRNIAYYASDLTRKYVALIRKPNA
jgi:hypothetical protein